MRIMKLFISTILVCAAFMLPAGRQAVAHDPNYVVQPDGVLYQNCDETIEFVVPTTSENADRLVPDGYTVSMSAGSVTPLIMMRRCETVTVKGVAVHDVIDSYIQIPIVPYDDPSCALNPCPAPPPHGSYLHRAQTDESLPDAEVLRLEFYLIQWVTNSGEFAHWLRESTGLKDRVRVVDGLEYLYTPTNDPAIQEFSFLAPSPAPSPFRVQAERTNPQGPPVDPGLNSWADTDKGLVIIHADHPHGPDNLFGGASGTIQALDADSPLGQMLGTEAQPFDDPLFGSAYYDTAQWTKCVRNASSPCSPDDHNPPEARPWVLENCDELLPCFQVPIAKAQAALDAASGVPGRYRGRPMRPMPDSARSSRVRADASIQRRVS